MPVGLSFLGLITLFIPKKHFWVQVLAIIMFFLGSAGLLTVWEIGLWKGGQIGALAAKLLAGYFGEIVASIVFVFLILLSGFSLHYLFRHYLFASQEESGLSRAIKRVMDFPSFKVSRLEPEKAVSAGREEEAGMAARTKPALSVEKILGFAPPPLSLLEEDKEKAQSGDIKENSLIIKKTLENFNIEVAMAEANVGPTVTQYALRPAEGVKLSKITGLSNNLALALAAHPIRIEAPIPGRSLVGIEIPNKARSRVRLRNLLADAEFSKNASHLAFVLGRGVAGEPMFGDLSRLPHLLVAGATGTGKTVFLNSFILTLLYRNTPETLRFILIDPKKVEFTLYSDLPHLLCPVIIDSERAVNSLKWLVVEMERRFTVLLEHGVKDIVSYNINGVKKGGEPLPYIVLIVDELADLMASKGKEIEASVVRIAQMARAVGIHLVLATQRPSTEVITGLIKANITSRISFQVATQIDSRTVLDQAGSEKLLGLGDMLYISAERVKPVRIQGSYVSEEEIKGVMSWVREKMDSFIGDEDDLSKSIRQSTEIPASEVESFSPGDDSLYEEAREIVIRHQKASASLLQRRLSIGYARAARILDMLEADGVVGPADGAKPREVFVREKENEQEF